MKHSSHCSCLGLTRMSRWVGVGVSKGEGEHSTNCECSQRKSYKAKEKKQSFPQTTLTHLLKFILDPGCNQPLANSTKHLCLSLKYLPNNHRPMGYYSNETFNKSLSKVIYSPLGKKWEKADSTANL